MPPPPEDGRSPAEDPSEQALSFGTAAEAYDRARPPYPPAALDWALRPGTRRVLDLGAGTGTLTRSLVGRGLDVVAVEPDPGMRAQLARTVPGVEVLDGAAEAVPLDDAGVDAVTVGQAWHWVDPARAVPEVARVLRPGGRLVLLWNLRDDDVPWTAQLNALLRERAPVPTDQGVEDPRVDGFDAGRRFGPLERLDVRWAHLLDVDGVVDLVASRSCVIRMPDAERRSLLDDVRAFARDHPDLAGRPEIPVPYVTTTWRTTVHAPS